MVSKARSAGRKKTNSQDTGNGNERLRTIVSYVGRIAKENSIDRLLIILADMGRDLISADRCTVWLLNHKADTLWSKVAHGMDRIEIPRTAGIAGCAASTGEPLIINDPYNDERFDKDIDKRTGYRTRNILALPIHDSESTIIGVFQAINKIPTPARFSTEDRDLLRVAATTTAHVLEAAMLQEEIQATQREILFTLSEAGELRSKETGYHVKRVAEYCRIFGVRFGLSESEAELVTLASPMHDIGKIAIPDSILLKPGPLTEEQREIMKAHTTLGYEMLKHSERKLIKSAAVICHEHHEKWDGTGYPRGLKGADTHIYGRITAISDVFDALSNDRVYKEAWEMDRIVKLFKDERGHHFDPDLIQVFLENIDEFVTVKETYKDSPIIEKRA
jgi:HD-GYP domain-containing protein (c-di-GMP phosphodiesterase class II)